MSSSQTFSVNEHAAGLVDRVKAAAAELKVSVARGDLGETLIDAGSRTRGSIAAGVQLAEICMGGLGTVTLVSSTVTPCWPWTLAVRSSNPVVACLACQYAGWRLSDGKGKDAFFALGSGRRGRLHGSKRCSKSFLTKTTPRQAHSSSRAAVRRRPLWLPRLPMTAVWHPIG